MVPCFGEDPIRLGLPDRLGLPEGLAYKQRLQVHCVLPGIVQMEWLKIIQPPIIQYSQYHLQNIPKLSQITSPNIPKYRFMLISFNQPQYESIGIILERVLTKTYLKPPISHPISSNNVT